MIWQNEIIRMKDTKGNPISLTYQKAIHAQLSAMFNHAIRYYELPLNPARRAGSIGEEESKEMLFWTRDEYQKFADEMMKVSPVEYIIPKNGKILSGKLDGDCDSPYPRP